MIPRLIPGTTPESNRHKRPWKASSRTPLVPLLDEKGVEFEGKIVVPLSLCNTPEHTNERLKFNALILQHLARWAEWRSRRGWEMVGKPKVKGPYLPATGDRYKTHMFQARAEQVIGKVGSARAITTFDQPEEVRWYFARAVFKRTTPSYIKLEDALFLQHLGEVYGQEKDVDSGWVNPMQHAEARRKRLGLKREDYLMGPLKNPL